MNLQYLLIKFCHRSEPNLKVSFILIFTHEQIPKIRNRRRFFSFFPSSLSNEKIGFLSMELANEKQKNGEVQKMLKRKKKNQIREN